MKPRVEVDAAGNERAVWTVQGKRELDSMTAQAGRLANDGPEHAGAVRGFQRLLTVAYFPAGEELAELRKADETV